MSVSIIWSATNGGAALSSPVDHGSGGNGDTLATSTIYLRHDGDNPITDCGFYLAELTGTYSGGASKSADLAEVLGWGDGTTATTFGGLLLNMNATGGWATWPSYSSKSGSNYNTFRTNVGDSQINKITLATEMGLTGSAGVVQAGDSPNVRFRLRVQIPTAEDTVGIRQFDQRLRYTYTS